MIRSHLVVCIYVYSVLKREMMYVNQFLSRYKRNIGPPTICPPLAHSNMGTPRLQITSDMESIYI